MREVPDSYGNILSSRRNNFNYFRKSCCLAFFQCRVTQSTTLQTCGLKYPTLDCYCQQQTRKKGNKMSDCSLPSSPFQQFVIIPTAWSYCCRLLAKYQNVSSSSFKTAQALGFEVNVCEQFCPQNLSDYVNQLS